MNLTGPAGNGLQLIPFRGLRYVPERVSSLAAVTSHPYAAGAGPDGPHHPDSADPHHIVRLILPRGATPAARAEQAAATLRRWLSGGVLAPDPEPALYVCEQRGEGLMQRGLVGALRLSEPAEGIVHPHEAVMPHVVEDRAGLMRATAAHLEPLLLAYRGSGGRAGAVIERTVLRPPLVTTTTRDGVSHRMWAVTDPVELAEIDADLSGRQALIADGHHRWATYLRLRSEQPRSAAWDFGLVMLVDTDRHPFQVRAIHRVLRRLPVAEALSAVEGSFRVRPAGASLPAALEALGAAARDGNAFLLTGGAGFHLIDRPDPDLLARTVPADRPRAWRALDAAVLHATLLDHLWKVPDGPRDIAYVHDGRAAVDHARRDGGTAVLLHPVREETVRDLAGEGVTMPRKSTSFGPKPAAGLVLRSLAHH
ncbi:DUF1015 domain-containing protein [Streptomyces enissocaesilis]|uniref:DUF1015 domain-containing protein n=1 Tax=Streptomyces enissocaesilis TaxID=332589 RepID=A0ABP6JTL7_9ACTN